ncbi:MAG: hypothetical protein ABIQ35_09980 [Verrucomicrobiota bacterium]
MTKLNYRFVGWFFVFSAMVLFATTFSASAQTPFAAGTFQGLLQSDSPNDESFGFMTLTLKSSGAFSMKFNLGVNKIGHHAYAKTGQFDQSGAYHFVGPDVTDTRYAIARFIDLQLDSVDSTSIIHGTVSDGTHSSVIELERVAVFGRENSPAQAGRYTFVFSNPDDTGLPHGFSMGTVVISSKGTISASGVSADGRAFHQAAALTVGGRWPVFAKLGGSIKGVLSGWMTFEDLAESDFSGSLIWLGPEVPGPNNAFVPEFSGIVSAIGSRYVAHPGRVLQTSDANNNVHLTLSEGGLEVPIERDLTLSTANKFIFTDAMRADALTVKAATGLFTGKFLHSEGETDAFRGVILQKQNFGGGFFYDRGGEVGRVVLQPQ